MLLALSMGCACPTFADMAVEDPDGIAEPAFVAEMEGALADFAAWTAREGVCVPAIEVRARIDTWSEDAVGLYDEPGEPILVEPGASEPRRVALHELCHALEDQEDHTDAHPELFPASDVEIEPGYHTYARRKTESFARRCEDGPAEIGLDLAVEAACGVELVGQTTRYLHDEIWVAAPALPIAEERVALSVETVAIPLDPAFYVYDAAVAGDDLLLLVDRFDVDDDAYAVEVLRVDPATGEVLGRVAVEPPGQWSGDGKLAASDDVPVALVGAYDADGAHGYRAYALDLAAGTSTALPVDGVDGWVEAAAVSEGDLYVAEGHAPMRGWDLATGAALDVGDGGAGWTLRPAAGGVELYGSGAIGRFDRASGAWTTTDLPSGLGGYARLSETERLFLYGWGDGVAPVVVDVETGTIAIGQDPCGEPRGSLWAELDDGALIVGAHYAEDGATVPVYRVRKG